MPLQTHRLRNCWYFYEIYASEDAYQLHRQTPHFRDYLRQTAHMSVSGQLSR
ncbi:antibiotic biosynthesis monooxygenase [Klebsiella pneumoniae]|nr:antibiotic biosynthesis monooxygenase [Klebsiella pneumoniae]MDV5299767.1 antibiotic biosynthesis monooxygenase [Klebsiella pneumoniae]